MLKTDWRGKMRLDRGSLTRFAHVLKLHLFYAEGHIQLESGSHFTEPKQLINIGDWCGWQVGNYEIVVTKVANEVQEADKTISAKAWKAMRRTKEATA